MYATGTSKLIWRQTTKWHVDIGDLAQILWKGISFSEYQRDLTVHSLKILVSKYACQTHSSKMKLLYVKLSFFQIYILDASMI